MKNKIKDLDKYTKLVIIVIVIGIIIRFYLTSIHQISGDACWQLSNARYTAENLKLPLLEQFGRDEPFWAPPLFHIVAAFTQLLFGEFAVKMISPIFGSLTLIFSFLVAKKLFNEKIVFYSIVFLAFIPLSLDFSVFSYVEGLLTFLSVLSVYFALNNKIVSSAITAGFAILTKYNGIFILPVLLYIIYSNNRKNKQLLYKNLLLLAIVSTAIGSIWFIRNWIYLGNPVWPFLNDFFNGYEVKSFAESGVGSVKLSNIFNLNAIVSIYIGIFGVPDGNINTLYYFDIPYLNILFPIWVTATIIFSIPILIGAISKKLKHKSLLFIWLISYIILVLLYVVNASWSVARFMLPAFPAISLIWANGIEALNKYKKMFLILIIIIILGFIFTSFFKISLAAKEWDFYKDDFEWVKSNTNKNAIFLSESQCVSYNINRQTVSPEINNLEKADYIFVAQNFKLDKRAIFNSEISSEIKNNSKLVYRNEKTDIEVYKT